MGKEFVGICRYLEKTNCEKQKGFYVIKKTDLERLLKQNNYELAARKLRAWKMLHWIDADADKLTRKVYDTDTKTYIRKVRIEIAVYEQLKKLMREE